MGKNTFWASVRTWVQILSIHIRSWVCSTSVTSAKSEERTGRVLGITDYQFSQNPASCRFIERTCVQGRLGECWRRTQCLECTLQTTSTPTWAEAHRTDGGVTNHEYTSMGRGTLDWQWGDKQLLLFPPGKLRTKVSYQPQNSGYIHGKSKSLYLKIYRYSSVVTK